MKRSIAVAALSAFAMAIVVPPLLYIAFDERAVLKAGVEYPPAFLDWSPTAQNDWRLANHRMVSGPELFLERLKNDKSFTGEYAQSVISILLLTFFGNLVFLGMTSALTRRSTRTPNGGASPPPQAPVN